MMKIIELSTKACISNSKSSHCTCHGSRGSPVWFKTLEKRNLMIVSYEIPLLLLLLVTAGGAILVKDLMSAVLLLGSYSFFLALVWAWLGAVDVAFVEAVIGAGLATVLFLLTLFGTNPKDTRLRRPPPSLATLIIFPILGFLLLYAASDLPVYLDPNSPASVHISPTYLEQSYQDTPHSECCDFGTDGLPIT